MSGEFKIDDLILVNWVDQNSHTNQCPAKGSLSRAFGKTVGFFLEEDDEWLCIGMERMEITNFDPEYRHVVSFPKCCIKSVEKLA